MYIDDILVTGKSEENHLQTVDEILSRPEAMGLRLKWKKCTFMLLLLHKMFHSYTHLWDW